jgi:hypothetical protein
MKTTSRRNFAKAITAALAAAPVALLTTTAESAQTSSKRAQVGPSVQKIFQHQDTPPALEILDGSLIVESTEEFVETSGTRFLYKSTTDTSIEHIRVIGDSGEKLYEDLYATEDGISSSIEIVWINEDKNVTGNVKITGGTVFQIDSDKKLGKSSQKKRRKFKYEHPGQGGGKRIRIESIAITNAHGRKTTFTATPTDTGDQFVPDEFRILIWR